MSHNTQCQKCIYFPRHKNCNHCICTLARCEECEIKDDCSCLYEPNGKLKFVCDECVFKEGFEYCSSCGGNSVCMHCIWKICFFARDMADTYNKKICTDSVEHDNSKDEPASIDD